MREDRRTQGRVPTADERAPEGVADWHDLAAAAVHDQPTAPDRHTRPVPDLADTR
jgi:hypothetical protein